jgi:hypothetical protein
MFGLFTQRALTDRLVPMICIAAPILTWAIETGIKPWFDVGFLTILLNGLLTIAGLLAISKKTS